MRGFRWDTLPTATPLEALIRALNRALGDLMRGASERVSGATRQVPTATARTLFTATLAQKGMYVVYATVQGGGAAQMARATFGCDGVTLARLEGTDGATLTLTNVAGAVQATQSAGSAKDILWGYLFLPC
jgi:hypothetical protein